MTNAFHLINYTGDRRPTAIISTASPVLRQTNTIKNEITTLAVSQTNHQVLPFSSFFGSGTDFCFSTAFSSTVAAGTAAIWIQAVLSLLV